MKGQRIGYVRVSTTDQNTERQLEGIALDRTFTDKASGKNTERPGLDQLLTFAREGDTVIVHSMDRLARNLDDLRRLVQQMTARGIIVQFVKESLIFTGEDSAMSKLLLSIMGAFAEFERALINERQKEGIAIAKAKGVYKGRKVAMDSDMIKRARELIEVEKMPKAQVARTLGVSRTTLYEHLAAA